MTTVTLTDSRGQAIAIGRGFIVIIACGIMWSLYSAIWSPLETTLNDKATNSSVQTGLDYTGALANNWTWVVVVTTVLGVIVLSVYQSRGGI